MGPRSPTMAGISSQHPTTERQGGEHLQMAIHQIPTEETSPTPGAAGTASNHQTLAVTPIAPSKTLTNKGKASPHIIPLSPPHGATSFTLTLPGGWRESSLSHPSKGKHQTAINTQADHPSPTWPTRDWPSCLTPLQRHESEQAPCSQGSDISLINWIDTSPYCPSFNLRPSLQGGRERARQKRGGISDKARQNAMWIFGDSRDITNWGRRKWIRQFTVLYRLGKEQLRRALQQFAQSRRCFYPRRDVIKWIGRSIGLSCEIILPVQEPLTRLRCGASSTCVEFPYTTILWFGVSFEDLNLAGSLPLGERVHTLYAHPSVEGHYFVRFEIHNCQPGASGAWFGSLLG
jgi:hypothetical protein